jgi:hypothetical protein
MIFKIDLKIIDISEIIGFDHGELINEQNNYLIYTICTKFI